MKRLLHLGAGLVLILVGMGLILPALTMARNFGELPAHGIQPLIIGVVLCCGGIASGVCGCLPRRMIGGERKV